MQIWHIWILIALAFFILEIFTAGFAVACFSFGAIGAAIGALCGLSLLWQLVIFAVISLLALIFVRPLVVKIFYKKGADEKTNADAIIGRKGRVSQTIDPVTGKGRVALDGDDWKAVSENGEKIEKGERVEIIGRDSIVITVKKA
ncbi:MAG: NfeD family protein [Bacteroidales bacterium]|nr:NfeD family protein [Bacteroidales bacterium]